MNGSVTGDLGKYGAKLPWADQGLQVNVGAEWREDSSDFEPDYVSQQGLAAGGGGSTPPIKGSFSVKEAFTEMRLPLIQHQAFAEDLSVEAGYRYSKYSEGFDTNTYKFGVDYAPTRDIRFRGSYQRAVRAPNIGELFSPTAVGLDGSLDPCAVPLEARFHHRAGQRRNAQAMRAHGCHGGKFRQHHAEHRLPVQRPASAAIRTCSPKPPIPTRPASSSRRTVVPNLTVSVDYYDIKLDQAIGPITENVIVAGCVGSNGNLAQQDYFCTLIHRQGGSLWLSSAGFVSDVDKNLGSIRTEGIDVKVSYRQPLTGLGSLLFSLEGTRTNELITTPVPQFGLSYNCVGLLRRHLRWLELEMASRVQLHLVDALGWARRQRTVAVLHAPGLAAGQRESPAQRRRHPAVPGHGAHPGLQLLRYDGHLQCLQEHPARAGRQQHHRQGARRWSLGPTARPAVLPAPTATATPSLESTTRWGATCSPTSRRSSKDGVG